MTEKLNIEVWIVMDADGDYAIGSTEDETKEVFEDQVGGSGPRRIVRLPVRMSPPAIEDGPKIDIPDTAGETQHIEAVAAE